jgi:hypothetical protein
MAIKTGYSRSEILDMTVRECLEYYRFYEQEKFDEITDFFNMYCIFNAESVGIGNMHANGVKGNPLTRYIDKVQRRAGNMKKKDNYDPDEVSLDDLDAQFKGFGIGS